MPLMTQILMQPLSVIFVWTLQEKLSFLCVDIYSVGHAFILGLKLDLIDKFVPYAKLVLGRTKSFRYMEEMMQILKILETNLYHQDRKDSGQSQNQLEARPLEDLVDSEEVAMVFKCLLVSVRFPLDSLPLTLT